MSGWNPAADRNGVGFSYTSNTGRHTTQVTGGPNGVGVGYNVNLAAGKNDDCFWDCGKVSIINKINNKTEIKLVKDIKINDSILTKYGYQKVLYIHVPETKRLFKVIEVTFESGDGVINKIGLTGQHLIYGKSGSSNSNDAIKPIPAGQLCTGDIIELENGKSGKVLKNMVSAVLLHNQVN